MSDQRNPTTRKFPRSMSEAWQREHASWIWHYKRSLGERIAEWLVWATLFGGLCIAVWRGVLWFI